MAVGKPRHSPGKARRDYFTKKWLQLRIMLAYLLILAGGAAGLAFHLHRHLRRELRSAMFSAHSTAHSPWEIVRDSVFTANAVAGGAVVLLAAVVTVAVTWVVARAARRITENVRLSVAGAAPDAWAPPPGMHDFRQLQQMLADALRRHALRVAELREVCRLLGDRVHAYRVQVEKPSIDADPGLMRDLHVKCEKLKHAYAQFTLPGEAPAEGEDRAGGAKSSTKNIRLGFQARWIARFTLLSAGGSLLFVLLLRRLFSWDLGKDFKHAFVTLRNLQELLVPIIGFSTLFYVLVVSLLSAVVTLFLSHRIAGPLFRFEQVAKHLGRGNLAFSPPPRRGDELGALSAALVQLQARCAQPLLPLRDRILRLDQAWEALDRAAPAQYEEQAGRTLAVIEEELGAIRQGLTA